MASRVLGTMVSYGHPEVALADDLELAVRFGAAVVEILPEWERWPAPVEARRLVSDRGLTVHSAHACWGSRTIRARRVDLGSTDPVERRESVEDLKRCVDWLHEAGGACLVVHPGGLSHSEGFDARRGALAQGLRELAEHCGAAPLLVCVENMPPGVHPGSRMGDLAELLDEINHPRLALALDTGHAHMSADLDGETRAAGARLATTHVHDNPGRQDAHLPPGEGTIDWPAWGRALDAVGYSGPVLLECIRLLRRGPERFRPDVLRGPLSRDSAGQTPTSATRDGKS